MSFGKHKGKLLSDVPDDYLWWCLGNLDWVGKEMLRKAIEERLGVPGDTGKASTKTTASGPTSDELEGVVKAWYRGLALDYHPDRRKGSNAEMAALNDAHERLRRSLGIKS
jgi:hypothetical protein